MTELTPLWAEYNKILAKGTRTARALELESAIHEIQKKMGSSRYDFDKKWAKIEQDGKPTITLPPMDAEPTPAVPTSNFTFEQAKARIGENDFALLEDCAMKAEAMIVVLARIFDTINVENQRNVARRGQGINIAIRLFEELKKDG